MRCKNCQSKLRFLRSHTKDSELDIYTKQYFCPKCGARAYSTESLDDFINNESPETALKTILGLLPLLSSEGKNLIASAIEALK